jgi:hypothetical protein
MSEGFLCTDFNRAILIQSLLKEPAYTDHFFVALKPFDIIVLFRNMADWSSPNNLC